MKLNRLNCVDSELYRFIGCWMLLKNDAGFVGAKIPRTRVAVVIFNCFNAFTYIFPPFQLLGCVSCTRWLLVPWLSVYCLNMVLMVATSLGMFLVPVPILNPSLTGTATHQALRWSQLLRGQDEVF